MSKAALVRPHYWAATTPSGDVLAQTVRPTHREAVAAVLDGWPWGWSRLRREGWRVVKVRIVPVEEPPNER